MNETMQDFIKVVKSVGTNYEAFGEKHAGVTTSNNLEAKKHYLEKHPPLNAVWVLEPYKHGEYWFKIKENNGKKES